MQISRVLQRMLCCQYSQSICKENPVISARIQMERFIRVHIFRRKSNTFRGINFFPVFTKKTELFCAIFSGQQGFLLWRRLFVLTHALLLIQPLYTTHLLSGVLQMVVVQWTSKECTKKRDACADLLFCS